MSLVINNNMMAANTSRNLTESYGRLATSVQRLSTGMRINSAADDAAGLAIRETMRAEIAAMRQGVRNAQDGISMIQTAEGALAVIDEKLIRMKELAEQAATGTYTAAQRLIIHSEFSAMAAEIDRIAESTEFNGIKLLNGDSNSAGFNGGWSTNNTWVANTIDNGDDGIIAEGEKGHGLWTNNSGWIETNGEADVNGDIHGGIKIHFGTSNNRAEDYYFVRMADSRTLSLFSEAEEGAGASGNLIHIMGSTANDQLDDMFDEGIESVQITKDAAVYNGDDEDYEANVTAHAGGYLAAGSRLGEESTINIEHGQELLINGVAYTYLNRGFNVDGSEYSEDGQLTPEFSYGGLVNTEALNSGSFINSDGTLVEGPNGVLGAGNSSVEITEDITWDDEGPNDGVVLHLVFTAKSNDFPPRAAYGTITVTTGNTDTNGWTIENAMKFDEDTLFEEDSVAKTGSIFNLGNEAVDAYEGTPEDTEPDPSEWVDPPQDAIPSVRTLEINEDCYGIEILGHHLAASSLDTSAFPADPLTLPTGVSTGALPSLLTQHQAQEALEQIGTAILRKENIRASLGSIQNRLENTITNLSIQAENLQASESRISDVDIASEMTEFVRNQVLTQAAVAMLGQANNLPQLALRLLG